MNFENSASAENSVPSVNKPQGQNAMKQEIRELKELVADKGEDAIRDIEVFDMEIEVVSRSTGEVLGGVDEDIREYPTMPCTVRGTLNRVEILRLHGDSLVCQRKKTSLGPGRNDRFLTSTSYLMDREECQAELVEIREQYLDSLKSSILNIRATARAVGPGWKMNLVAELDDFLASVTENPDAFVSTEMIDTSVKKKLTKSMSPSM